MNEERFPNNYRPKKDYRQLYKTLKGRCEEISKDNDALSSRLINLKLLIYKAENQCRKIQDRLDYHGVDYHAAAAAASNYVEVTDFVAKKSDNAGKSRPKHVRKKKPKVTSEHLPVCSSDPNNVHPINLPTNELESSISTPYQLKDNLII